MYGGGCHFFFFRTVMMMMHLSAHRKHAPVSSSALMIGLPAEDGSHAHAVMYVQLNVCEYVFD